MIGGTMKHLVLVLILVDLAFLNIFPAYSKTTEKSISGFTTRQAHYDLKEAVAGLDSDWNAKSSTPFLKGNKGFDFNLPGKNRRKFISPGF